jgi:hypothetical protein
MFGSGKSEWLRWVLAALSFVWFISKAGAAMANPVTVCQFVAGKDSEPVQITVESAVLPGLLALDNSIGTTFIGPCLQDCNLHADLCGTAPDACHTDAGTCNATTGHCEFPNSPDGTSCVGTAGLGCDSCIDGACVMPVDCNFELSQTGQAGFCTTDSATGLSGLAYGYCDRSTHTCKQKIGDCPTITDPAVAKCYSDSCDPELNKCVEFCLHPPCGAPGNPGCGEVNGCTTDSECPNTNACLIGSCSENTCKWQPVLCPTSNPNVEAICDPKKGCVDFPNVTPPQSCPYYLNTTSSGGPISITDVTGEQITLNPAQSAQDCSSVADVPAGIEVTSCGYSVNACDALQNTSAAAVTATDVNGNQFPIAPGGTAVICNSVARVPSGVTLSCNGCCTYTNTTRSPFPVYFQDANFNNYLLAGGQEALVCAAVPNIPPQITQSCPTLP